MKGKHFLSISDLTAAELSSLISEAADSKDAGWSSILQKKTLAILFEKPSTRTRVSFEVAMRQLGGEPIYLSPAEVGLGERESVADVAQVLGRYVNAITARTFSHKTMETLAEYSGVPVINALSDLEHPCQALADLLTIYEHKKDLEEMTIAYIGDGNNVANSLLLAAGLSGMKCRFASPPGYSLQANILKTIEEYAEANGGSIICTEDPKLAAEGADVVYTDTWTSMGQEVETQERNQAFSAFQVNKELMSLARPDAIFMHCLPAHRGEEVSEDVLDSPQSVVFDQAENRLHAQKALLVQMLGGLELPHAGYH